MPDFLAGGAMLFDESERERIVQAGHELLDLMRAVDQQYDLHHSAVRMKDAGTIIVDTPCDAILEASATPLGVYHVVDRTWRWDGPFASDVGHRIRHLVPEELSLSEASRVRFQQDDFRCNEGEAWYFAALAVKRGKYEGAFRMVSGPLRKFVLFKDLHELAEPKLKL